MENLFELEHGTFYGNCQIDCPLATSCSLSAPSTPNSIPVPESPQPPNGAAWLGPKNFRPMDPICTCAATSRAPLFVGPENDAAETEFRVVRQRNGFVKIRVLQHRNHRPEDLLAANRHGGVDVGEDSRFDEVSAVEAVRAEPSNAGRDGAPRVSVLSGHGTSRCRISSGHFPVSALA